jgi:UDP-glucoronosyl and UDP-glucosyl transferase
MSNAERMQYRGYGRHYGRFNTVQSDRLAKTVREVASNRSYTDNMRRASAIFRSRPMNSRQTVVWWVEHVIQHGADYLHSHAADMVWYEYLMLDIFALFILLPVATLASGSTALVCWLIGRRKGRNSSSTTSTQRVDKKRQ